MAETLAIPHSSDRREIYAALLPQLQALVSGENDRIANAANLSAALKEAFGFLWVGFYFTSSEDELVLGPFQGPVACTRIRRGKGVCGTAWAHNKTIIVPDVDAFPGHIACSSLSRSEIVIPLRNANGVVYGVLDVDSISLNDFSETDAEYLQQIAVLLS